MADSRKTSSTIKNPDEQPNKYNINGLTESILIEILIRVPESQSAQHCKCVCKRWLSLISNPYFITCFINQHRDVSGFRLASKTFTLLHQYRYFAYHDIEHDPRATITSHPVHTKLDAIMSPRNFDLGFLQFGQTADILATSEDMVVCYDRWISFELLQKTEGTAFHICNLLTKKWICLPPTPSSYWRSGLVGFLTYEPDFCKFSVREFMLNYKLVHIPKAKEFSVEVFSSETGKWSKSVALTCHRFDVQNKSIKNAVNFRRKLHWIINNNSILAFDPFDPDKQCRLISLPTLDDQTKEIECFGVCKQQLRVSLLERAERNHRVVVWDLKDYDAGEWCLQYNVHLNDMQVNYLIEQQLKFEEGTCLLAVHPHDEAVLYLRYKNHILMCNIQERTLQVISECSRSWNWSLRNERDTAYILEQPCWPSPIPSLVSCTTSK